MKVVGIDGISGALEAIGNGDMVCTVANSGYMQGGYGVAYAYAAWSGKVSTDTMPARMRGFNSGGILITKDNLQDYIDNNVKNVPTFDFTNLEFPIVSEFHFEE